MGVWMFPLSLRNLVPGLYFLPCLRSPPVWTVPVLVAVVWMGAFTTWVPVF